MEELIIYCDGSCHNNGDKDGAYAFVLLLKDGAAEKVLLEGSEFVPETTNNRMEMKAALEGIRNAVKLNYKTFEVRSDSSYLINCFRQKWYLKWRMNGWKNSKGKTVENKDLWEELLIFNKDYDITWIHVKGHVGVKYNERCDELAGIARKAKGVL